MSELHLFVSVSVKKISSGLRHKVPLSSVRHCFIGKKVSPPLYTSFLLFPFSSRPKYPFLSHLPPLSCPSSLYFLFHFVHSFLGSIVLCSFPGWCECLAQRKRGRTMKRTLSADGRESLRTKQKKQRSRREQTNE